MRPALLEDAAALSAIYAPYVATNAVSYETEAPNARQMRSRMEQSDGVYPWIVAAEGEIVLGYGYAYAKPFRPGEPYQHIVEVGVYAAGDLEGKGIRRSLLTSLVATLTNQCFTQALCTLITPNDRLIQVYESTGFRRAGVFREVCYKNGQWSDIGLWQRELAEPTSPPRDLRSFHETGVVRA